MDQANRDTLNFCIEFLKNNFSEHSQTSMCLVWLKKAVEILENERDLSSGDFIIGELNSLEKYIVGNDSSSSSRDMMSKIDMVVTLLKDL